MGLDACRVDILLRLVSSLRWQSVELLIDLESLRVKDSPLLNRFRLVLDLLVQLSVSD